MRVSFPRRRSEVSGQKARSVGSFRNSARKGARPEAFGGELLLESEGGRFPFVLPYRPCWLLQRGNFPVYFCFRRMMDAYAFARANESAVWRLVWLHFEFGNDPEEVLPRGIVM